MGSLESKAIVSFGGGQRGIAQAIIQEFNQQGYEPYLFHRKGEEAENEEVEEEEHENEEVDTNLNNALDEINEEDEENLENDEGEDSTKLNF